MKLYFIFSIFLCFFMAGCVPNEFMTEFVPYERQPVEPKVTTMPLFNKKALERIGIYVKDNTRRVRQGGIRRVEDEFARILIEKGYHLASRSDIDLLSKELDLQHSAATENAIAQKARLLNISAILFVDINKMETHFKRSSITTSSYRGYYRTYAAISARLVTAATGRVVWMSSHEGKHRMVERTDGSDALPPVAQIVASGLP